MIYLAIAAVAGIVEIASAHFLFAYLRTRDQREERLLDRIQAPEQAVARSLTGDDFDLVPAVNPDDDGDYWHAHGIDTKDEN